ncbi:hypothetical protein MJT46_002923 [Ovis ammon polii x Ovis aries]|nr:hypothetical protein MJT46_002923 [Ovis ammon polii x Ovis aries]
MVPPSAKLPHHRFLLSGLARPGRPCADGEGAATALPKGCFRSSAQCKGVRRLFLKQGPSPGARPDPPEQCGEPTLWPGSQAPFPSRGSPNLLPPPPSARRHFVRSRCDTDTIVGLDGRGEAQDPHALGSRLPAPCAPQGSRPTYAYPTNRRIPFAPHSLALSLQSRRRRSYRLQRAARMRVWRALASPHLLPAPAYRGTGFSRRREKPTRGTWFRKGALSRVVLQASLAKLRHGPTGTAPRPLRASGSKKSYWDREVERRMPFHSKIGIGYLNTEESNHRGKCLKNIVSKSIFKTFLTYGTQMALNFPNNMNKADFIKRNRMDVFGVRFLNLRVPASFKLNGAECIYGSVIMNGSSVANTAPNIKSKEDQVLNGHDEKENPFAEYMWMENEEDFNRQVEEELQEQEFLDRCFQEMLDEEDQDWFIPSRDLPQAMGQLQQQLNGLSVSDGHASEDILSKSNLNPDAKEFVPGVKY